MAFIRTLTGNKSPKEAKNIDEIIGRIQSENTQQVVSDCESIDSSENIQQEEIEQDDEWLLRKCVENLMLLDCIVTGITMQACAFVRKFVFMMIIIEL